MRSSASTPSIAPPSESVTLVLLAAGLGSRFGGAKQWTSIGPGGRLLLDYTIHDAIEAGFDRVLLVIREEDEPVVRSAIVEPWSRRVRVDLAYQRMELTPASLPAAPGRVKPLGTGHAIWSALPRLSAPFFVANADDVYGPQALADARVAWDDLRQGGADAVVIGYPLHRTLSTHGAVSRAICDTDDDGRLLSLTEHTAIRHDDDQFDPDALVSMNLIGFTADLDPILTRAYQAFHHGMADPLKDEFLIAHILNRMIEEGRPVSVRPTRSEWIGVTYREDAEWAGRRLADHPYSAGPSHG